MDATSFACVTIIAYGNKGIVLNKL